MIRVCERCGADYYASAHNAKYCRGCAKITSEASRRAADKRRTALTKAALDLKDEILRNGVPPELAGCPQCQSLIKAIMNYKED